LPSDREKETFGVSPRKKTPPGIDQPMKRGNHWGRGRRESRKRRGVRVEGRDNWRKAEDGMGQGLR
jgi:hypothetical protein